MGGTVTQSQGMSEALGEEELSRMGPEGLAMSSESWAGEYLWPWNPYLEVLNVPLDLLCLLLCSVFCSFYPFSYLDKLPGHLFLYDLVSIWVFPHTYPT